jgi:Fur family transcriptional regulator, ferric uptake regulator
VANDIKEDALAQRLERDIEQRLADSGARFTTGRRLVVEAVAGADGPLTASEIHDSTSSVPLSSLYRSLVVLTDAGVLARHHGADETTRYELSEHLTEHHHHLVCVSCGSIVDVMTTNEQEERLDGLVESLGAAASFTVTGHRLEIEGLCATCR